MVSCTFAAMAIDTTGSVTAAQFGCLNSETMPLEMVLGRVYTADGMIDEVGIQNIIQAFNGANLEGYDAVFVPCLANCKNNLTAAADQVNAVINRLNQEFQDVFIWVQIDKTSAWGTNQQTNQQFVTDVLNAVFNTNGGAGVITNYNAWSSIVGAQFTQAAQIAQYLLWVNWNGKMDLTTGWTPFGGWQAPYAHQYAGGITTNNCTPGVSLDYSYFDDGSFLKLRKGNKMTRRANKINKFNRH
jgi:hypothetical protein